MPNHSVGHSSPYPVFGGGGLQQPRLEPATVYNQHEQTQKANVMQHTVPPDEQNSIIPTHQNSTATSASQGSLLLIIFNNLIYNSNHFLLLVQELFQLLPHKTARAPPLPLLVTDLPADHKCPTSIWDPVYPIPWTIVVSL